MADANHLRAGSVKQLCYFCGNARHPRKNCIAKDAACNFCQKVGHYFKVCQKRLGNRTIDAIKKTAAIQGPKLATLSASETSNNTRVLCNVKINGIVAKSLLDTGSSATLTEDSLTNILLTFVGLFVWSHSCRDLRPYAYSRPVYCSLIGWKQRV